MAVDLSKFSLAQWYPDREQHKCGYCKSLSGSISYGMYTEELSVDDYKNLIDRGWRRSGKYCYKPKMDKTCCPQYTIRCDAIGFTLNKSHKKIVKKFNKFLNDGILKKNEVSNLEDSDQISSTIPGFDKHSTINLHIPITSGERTNCNSTRLITTNVDKNVSQNSPIRQEKPNCSNEKVDDNDDKMLSKKSVKEGTGADPDKPPCKKAKLLRLERKKQKVLQKGEKKEVSSNQASDGRKSLKQFLEEISQNPKHKLKLKLISSDKVAEEVNEKVIEFQLYEKYQRIVHNDPPERISMRGFLRFLVSSPLKPKPFPSGIQGPGYGSFHQQYWIDDNLIAVGVIDVLPGCVSSVYFFYDPDYRDLTLGTYGSLREIQLVQDFQSKIPDLQYYYMGFYIHSCPKMRYKGRLNPSYLLCPETYVWFPIEVCLEKLNVSKYSRLNDNSDCLDVNACSNSDIETIKVVYHSQLMRVKDYLQISQSDRSILENLGNLVGEKCAHSIVFWMD